MSEETATNPVEVEGVEGSEIETQEVELESVELDDEGNPIEREPEDEEIELDELKLKVPKDQAQKVREALLRQADYTKKTQELAESRKVFEAERQSFQQASSEELGAAAQVTAIDQRLAEYGRIDWATWNAQAAQAAAEGYPEEQARVQAAFMEFSQLKDARGQAMGMLNHLRTTRSQQAQQEAARRIEETRTALIKDIPDWSEATEAKVADFGIKGYGFTRDEMADMKIDPRIAKAMHRLMTLEEQAGKQTKAKQHLRAQETKPAAKAAGSGGAIPPQALDDRLSTEEWARRRNAQVAKKAA